MDIPFFSYLIESSISLSVLTVFFWLLLRKETFFEWNRRILLASILLALALPLIPLPNTFLVKKAQVLNSWEAEITQLLKTSPVTSPEVTVNPVPIEEQVDLTYTPARTEHHNQQEPTVPLRTLIYGLGVGLLAIRFIVQLLAVYQQIRRADITRGKRYHLASMEGDFAPFSFGKFIFLNPNKYDEAQFFQILSHEKIHVRLWHTLDLLAAECLIILQWFNPFAWLHRQLIVQNLEFQTDKTILDTGENRKEYQYHLLQIAVPNYPLSISTNYNQSLLKKRITMMNRKNSSVSGILKYILLLPLFFILLVSFKKATLSEDSSSNTTEINWDRAYIYITDQATPAEIKMLQEKLPHYGLAIRFEKLIFDQQRIKEAEALFYEGNEVVGIAEFSSDQPGEFIFFSRERDRKLMGSTLDLRTIERMQEEDLTIKIFKAGVSSDQEMIQQLTAAIDERQKKKPQNKFSQHHTYTQVFEKPDEDILKKLLKEKINANDGKVVYKVDGVVWPEADALAIPTEDIETVSVKRVDQNKTIDIIRKLPAKTTEKDVNVYLVITSDFDKKTLDNCHRELAERGLFLNFERVKYDQNGKLMEVEVYAKDDRGFNGSITYSFEDSPSGKIFIYRIAEPKGDTPNDSFGMGYGTNLDNLKDIPEDIKTSLRAIQSGYFIGSVSSK